MKLRKITAALTAAAILAAAAPVTGALPDVMGVTASAASPDPAQTEYKMGDKFYAVFDGENWVTDSDVTEEMLGISTLLWECTVLTSDTVSVHFISPVIHIPDITYPSQISGYTVTAIDSGGNYVDSVTVPDTVTTIGESAFADNVSLKEVKFGANSQLKMIDKWAFQNCRSLESITIPANVETIAQGAFLNINREGVKLINPADKTDYSDIYSLESVSFAKDSKLKIIDQWAFQGQEALKLITLPDSLEKIGYGVFNHCTALTKINVPKNVDEIGAFAFQTDGWNHESGSISEITVDENNPNFKSVDGVVFNKDGKTIVAYPVAKSGKYDIPADVNKIAEGAFGNCQKLTSVTIPEGVTEVPENAFTYCIALAEVKLPSALTTIAKWGFEATALTSIDIPKSVTAIDAHAFESSSLKQISGAAGSYAETFAKENGYTFKVTEKPDDTSKPTDTSNTFTDDSGDKAADIEVIAKPNVIPKEAHFSVRLDDKNTTAERIAYNCFFTYNGAEYEPTDTVTVRIPVPVAMRDIADTLKVYHLQDGKYVNMKAKVDNGYLVFDTDHFSTYVVTAENLADESGSDNSGSSDNSTTTPDNSNPNTGVTAVATAFGVMALAGAAVIAVKKRK